MVASSPAAPASDPAAPASLPPGRTRLGGLALSVFTVALASGLLLAAEGLLRLFDPHHLEDDPAAGLSRMHRYSETYGWELRPGFRGEWRGHRTTVNARGYRGPVHPYPRTPGRSRLVMLGDSLAFGYEVADAETFSALLESWAGYDVVNLSVPGYGTDQELLRLENEGMGYQPDVVVLNVCLENDLADNVSPTFFYDGVHRKPYFRLEGGQLRKYDDQLRLSPLARAALWLRERSHLYNRLVKPAPVPVGGEWAHRMAETLREPEDAVAITAALIRRASEVAAAGGARFLALVYPNKAAYKDRSPLLEALLASPFLQGVTVVDMGERYHARSLRFHDLALDAMGHLSPAGHRVTAEIIQQLLAGR